MNTRRPESRTSWRLAAILVALSVAVTLLAGCDAEPPSGAADNPGPPVEPAPADLSTPESSVRSYLDWVSLSYRTGDSEDSSHTMTPWEGVRVDSYIEFNRQQGRAIEQELTRFEIVALESAEPTSILVATEEWAYRYFSIETGRYVSDPLTASFDATYTVVLTGEDWLVDRVEVFSEEPVE